MVTVYTNEGDDIFKRVLISIDNSFYFVGSMCALVRSFPKYTEDTCPFPLSARHGLILFSFSIGSLHITEPYVFFLISHQLHQPWQSFNHYNVEP